MEKDKVDLASALKGLANNKPQWKNISNESLNVEYAIVFPRDKADEIFSLLESTVEYYSGDLTKVRVFGKWHQIPRQQVAFGDEGLKYHFSGVTIPAKPWSSLLQIIKEFISIVTGTDYNFVLINRYRNGSDHIGEHRDDEAELDPTVPIASLSLGQERDFVLKHIDCQKKGPEKRNIAPIKLPLQHGSLLLMKPPTNKYWNHSLPKRKRASGVRINLTFRKINNN